MGLGRDGVTLTKDERDVYTIIDESRTGFSPGTYQEIVEKFPCTGGEYWAPLRLQGIKAVDSVFDHDLAKMVGKGLLLAIKDPKKPNSYEMLAYSVIEAANGVVKM